MRRSRWRLLVWIGAPMAVIGLGAVTFNYWPLAGRTGVAMVYLGGFAVVLGIGFRNDARRKRLARRGFSSCTVCDYPFDEQTPGDAMLTCSECGTTFRADKARAWQRGER